ncbi:MAG TPA: hypothetical protein VFR23_17815 [Jiangellaceae bacterium]|nr:hypothetical protein [Jiangellaceae bacterium]
MSVPSPTIRKSFWSTTAGSLTIAGLVIVFLLAVAAVYVIGARSVAGKSADVAIATCDLSGTTVSIKYVVVNSSDRERDYRITFEVQDSDGTRVGDADAIERNVPAGGKVHGERHVSITSARSPSCVVADVS